MTNHEACIHELEERLLRLPEVRNALEKARGVLVTYDDADACREVLQKREVGLWASWAKRVRTEDPGGGLS